MTAIKLKLKLTPSGDIDLNDDALAISTYVQVRGSIEGVDSDLRAALFRLAAALDDRVIAHSRQRCCSWWRRVLSSY
jgi:hypothetical protein